MYPNIYMGSLPSQLVMAHPQDGFNLLNLPADRALAQQCNALVHSVHGMSVSAFYPWRAVPIEGLGTS